MSDGQKRGFGAVLPIVLLGYFLILMDNSVVFTSSLSIALELGMDSVAVSWVSTAYALTFGGFLLLGGRLGDILGRRRIFLAGLVVFTVASFLVGAATSGSMLVAMRAIQGMGSSMLAPSTLALLIDNYEGEMRTRSIAAYGTVAGIGSSVGMVLSGFITAYASWRYAFYIDVPVGVLLIVLTLRFIRSKNGSDSADVDWVGAILSVIGFAGLIYGIDGRVGREISMAIAVVTLAALVLRERRAQVPLMPLGLFANLGRSAAYVGRFLMMGASMSYFFLMPTALQQVYGFTPLMAAIGFLPLTVTQFFSSLTVPALTSRLSNARVLIMGSVIDALGLLLGWRMGVTAGYLLGVAISMVLIGMGQALIVSPLTVAGVAGASEDIPGAASGVVNVFHQVGAAIGLAAVSTAVAGMDEAASIDAAQGMMLALIVLTGICGVLVLVSESCGKRLAAAACPSK
ncbi:MFS transporter [Olsenella sp. Marseille-P4559]|uniref:MFS transporter n=1 Tax=Olsenella sp. Marseille-P4559 TaxID=2364795 RepID=UPI0013EF1FFE|nr:MFS transporter [Olsenella sp. Marseille-P4559]